MRDDESDVNQMFQRAAGGEPSADDALARIRPRIRGAHQRRAAVRGGVGLVGVVALGAIVARSGDDGVNRLRVASTGSTVETTTVALPSPVVSSSVTPTTATSLSQSMARSQVVPPPPSATVEVTPAAPTSARAAVPTTVAATTPTVLVIPPAPASDPTSMSQSTAVTSSSTSTSSSSTSSTSSSTSTSTTLAASTASFSSAGGSIKISYTPTVMTLLEVTPAAGFTVGTTEAQPDEIQVEFRRAGEDGSDIHIRLVNGVPQQVHFDE